MTPPHKEVQLTVNVYVFVNIDQEKNGKRGKNILASGFVEKCEFFCQELVAAALKKEGKVQKEKNKFVC